MVGLWSYNGPAILQALRPEGKVDQIKIVCFDDERATLAAVKQGAIFGTVAQQPFEYVYQSVQTAAKILRGDRSVILANKTILIQTVVIRKKDVDDYTKKLNQLLGITSGQGHAIGYGALNLTPTLQRDRLPKKDFPVRT
ncbi:MAG TPA: substrate-binding domain-containing protein [Pyrinomonadaceae bacterium]|nr:substrate-binding domain-containing protein [Pyrinomonadaceae bacterium]